MLEVTPREGPKGRAKFEAGAGAGWWEWETVKQAASGGRDGSRDREHSTSGRGALVSSCAAWC